MCLRVVAASVLALLFGFQLSPLLQAQSAKMADCCMAAEGKGCSMHLHRGQAVQNAPAVAALQPRCPCTPLAPASTNAQDAVSLAASHVSFALAAQDAALVQPRNLLGVEAEGSGSTRGPPSLTFAD